MKKPFETEMDDTRQAVGQIVGLCTTIALHQEFGVGKTRLERIKARIDELENQNTEVIMTPEMEVSDIDGSKDAAEVDKEFRKQQLNFIKRVRAQALGRIAATTQPVNVLAEQGVQDKVQEIMQQVSQQSFERRRRR